MWLSHTQALPILASVVYEWPLSRLAYNTLAPGLQPIEHPHHVAVRMASKRLLIIWHDSPRPNTMSKFYSSLWFHTSHCHLSELLQVRLDITLTWAPRVCSRVNRPGFVGESSCCIVYNPVRHRRRKLWITSGFTRPKGAHLSDIRLTRILTILFQSSRFSRLKKLHKRREICSCHAVRSGISSMKRALARSGTYRHTGCNWNTAGVFSAFGQTLRQIASLSVRRSVQCSYRDYRQRPICGTSMKRVVNEIVFLQVRSAMAGIITRVHAREIFDSRGNPTVEVDVTTSKGLCLKGSFLLNQERCRPFSKESSELPSRLVRQQASMKL